MDTDDGWPKVWAEMSDDELRDRLRHYLFLAANSLRHSREMTSTLLAKSDPAPLANLIRWQSQRDFAGPHRFANPRRQHSAPCQIDFMKEGFR
jgi:hypothetical protein